MNVCEFCNKSYSSTGNLRKHQVVVHDVSKRVICECGYVPKNAQGLNSHFKNCIIHRNGVPPQPSKKKGVPSPVKGKKLEDIVANPELTRRKLSLANSNRNPVKHTEASKAKISNARTKHLENSPHIQWFEVDGIKFQGTWERDVAIKLSNCGYKFQRNRIKYDKVRTYTPDIYLPELNIWIEIKGWMSDRDKVKYRKFFEEHKDKDIRLVLGKSNFKNFDAKDVLKLPKLIDEIMPS